MEKKKIYFLGSVLIAFLGVGCQKAPINQPLPQKNTPKSTIETSGLDKINFPPCGKVCKWDFFRLQ